MTEPREPDSRREPARPASPTPAADTRRFLARVLAIGAVIVALGLAAWARACAQVERCVDAGGRWDEEWKVCRQ